MQMVINNDTQQINPMFELALAEAHRLGLNAEDQLDCAVTFLEKWFLTGRSLQVCDGLVYLSARNHARDYKRTTSRRATKEVSTLQLQECNFSTSSSASTENNIDPVSHLLNQDLTAALEKAIASLNASPRDLFLRRYFNNESVENIADVTGRTPEAVRKVLNRACIHIRACLLRQGYLRGDFRVLYIIRLNC